MSFLGCPRCIGKGYFTYTQPWSAASTESFSMGYPTIRRTYRQDCPECDGTGMAKCEPLGHEFEKVWDDHADELYES